MLVLCLLAALTSAITALRDQGEIQSPNYPAAYPNNMDKTWNLEVAPGQRIKLYFESFDLEAAHSCGYDYVQISHGSFQQKYCGSSKPTPIISSRNTMTVTFHTDGSANGNGFKATWTTSTTSTWTTATKTVGLLISGGYGVDWSRLTDVEVWSPSTGQQCTVSSLPTSRQFHSQEGSQVCGGAGSDTKRSCLTLTARGRWERTTTYIHALLEERHSHVSWASPSGTILMGGWDSRRTSEKIDESGTSSYSFNLEYDTVEACAINLGSSVILTGGYYSPTYSSHPRVSEYDEAGFIRYLPDLNQGRRRHGCSHYEDGEGRKTYLVSGGLNGDDGALSTTEVLLETGTAWTLTGRLPSPRNGLQAARIDNKIVMTGGKNSSGTYYDEILKFDPLTGEWSQTGRMIQNREHHAVSIITSSESFC